MPFTTDAFLDVFAVYNTSWWPAALILWIATLAAFVVRVVDRGGHAWILGLLAIHWAWSAVAYHALLFTRINPAAWLFAVLFLIEAALLLWYGVTPARLRFAQPAPFGRIVAYGLVGYGLLYPLIALAGGHAYPRVPTFGVPCPTTIVTVGFLLLVSGPIPWPLAIVPIAWTIVAGSAALLLGMWADLVLPIAGAALALRVIGERRRVACRPRRAGSLQIPA